MNRAKNIFLFDLDETLLDFHTSEQKALEIVLTSYGLPFSEDIYRHFMAYNRSLWLEIEKGTITRTELFTLRFNDIFEYCGNTSAGPDPLKVNDDFINTMAQNGVCLNGALDFIRKVREEIDDSGIYILTNGATVNAKDRIATTGLGEYIDGIFVSDTMEAAKPSAKFFEICLRQIGAQKEDCIMIGDSLTSDMLGAKNASLTSVWFQPAGDVESAVREYEIDYCASDYEELYKVLKHWAEDRTLQDKNAGSV